ncbi:hypothetical protein [Sphingobacterium bovistauri]|uniref:PepSY domain-containing protein n=1 Tax=Sphingobacterium bovistauri TaxID=2781959 RepID=A0ABS7Z4R1_9SPHI|nr:hypothetical protein [Sphingobacterium bovistauri]MCA5005181.1 hypothetical protein [Sphingobacterium bovistauri]
MKSQSSDDRNTNKIDNTEDITKQDIINLALLKNINFKDKDYAKEHIIIQKKNIKTSYEVEIIDIDGQKHKLIFDLKKYSK